MKSLRSRRLSEVNKDQIKVIHKGSEHNMFSKEEATEYSDTEKNAGSQIKIRHAVDTIGVNPHNSNSWRNLEENAYERWESSTKLLAAPTVKPTSRPTPIPTASASFQPVSGSVVIQYSVTYSPTELGFPATDLNGPYYDLIFTLTGAIQTGKFMETLKAAAVDIQGLNSPFNVVTIPADGNYL